MTSKHYTETCDMCGASTPYTVDYYAQLCPTCKSKNFPLDVLYPLAMTLEQQHSTEILK
jgi:Zn finger protein HypA/HybF involved in hydrogenase expression